MSRCDLLDFFEAFLFLIVVFGVLVSDKQHEVVVFKTLQLHGDGGLVSALFYKARFVVADEFEVRSGCKTGLSGKFSPSESGSALFLGVVVQDILMIILVFDDGFKHVYKIENVNRKVNRYKTKNVKK